MPKPSLRSVTLGSLFCCIPLVSLPSFAENSSQNIQSNNLLNLSLAELGKIEISIATGISTPIDKAPAVASVITAKEMQAIGARTLNDVLENVPGLHVALSTINRLDSVYSIRGIHTGLNPHVLLMINNVPLQWPSQGGRPILFRMPVTNIDRVEVIRGPGSAIYGADAYSGVINVITKKQSDSANTEIGVRGGSFDMQDLWLQYGNKIKDWDLTFSLSSQHSNGDEERIVSADLQSTLDSIIGTSASLSPGPLSTRYQILDTHLGLNNSNWAINLWSWISQNAGVGAGSPQVLDPNGSNEDDLFLLDVSYKKDFSEDWNSNLHLSYVYYDTQAQLNLLPPGAVVPIGADGNLNFAPTSGIVAFPDGLIGNPGAITEDSQVEYISTYTGWDTHRLRTAVGYRYQRILTNEEKNFGPGVIDGSQPVVTGDLTSVSDTQYVFLANASRNIQYLSIQDEWKIAANWELTYGVRYDKYSDFGSTTNPRIALVWSSTHEFTTKLLYGSAFRAPSFSEQLIVNNPVGLGNPNLDPEKINTLELSLNYRPSENFQTTLSLFNYEADDLVAFIPDVPAGGGPPTTSTAQNARTQEGSGFEWEMEWQAHDRFWLKGNYAWQDSEDKDTGLTIADAPKQQITLNSHWEFAKSWFLHAHVNWVGDRERVNGDPRDKIDNYSLMGITLQRQQITPNLDLAFAIRNLTDEEAFEPSNGTVPDDYPLEGRSFWLELRYQINR